MLKEEKTCLVGRRALDQFQGSVLDDHSTNAAPLHCPSSSNFETMTKGLYGTELLQPQERIIERQQLAHPALCSRTVVLQAIIIAKDYPTAILESKRIQ